MGLYHFDCFDTREGASHCFFAMRKKESRDAYLERLRDLWKTHPGARQHLAVYAKYHRRGKVRFEGPMADVAKQVVSSIMD